MKIIKITFENINNLKGGPHVIAFDKAPLASAGLFGITGPTGSGKSTLLDVITLALFNQVPRFSKAVSKKEIQDLGSIMTHHTNSASASIEYEVKGKRYTSSWEIAKARTGNLRDYHMEVRDEQSGQIISDKKSEVPAKNEAIIGLNYDQFVKSIILAQGEFSKFLKADKNERGQLLENITGMTIYRDIGKLAFERQRDKKVEIEQVKAVLQNIQIFTDEERTQINQLIEEIEKQKLVFDQSIIELTATHQVKISLRDLVEKINNKNLAFTEIKKALTAFEPQLKKLKLQEVLNPLKEDILLHRKAEKDFNEYEQKLISEKNALNQIEKTLDDVLTKMQGLTKQSVSSANFREIMTSFEKEVNEMDQELIHLKTKGNDQRQRINEKINDAAVSISDKANPTEALTILHRKQQTFHQQLLDANISDDADLALLKNKIKEDRKHYDQLKKLQHCIEHVNETSTQLKLQRDKLGEYESNGKTANVLLEKTTTIADQLQETAKLLQKQKEDAITIANLEQLRPQLEHGQPCPLCGALDHPFSKHAPENILSDIDKNITATQHKITNTRKELNQINGHVSAAKASIQLTKEAINKNEVKHTEAVNAKTTAKKQLVNDESVNEATLSETIDILEKNNTAVEQGIEALEQQKIIHALTKEFKTLEKIFATYKKLDAKRRSKTMVKDVSRTCNDLQDAFIQQQTKQHTSVSNITNLEKQAQQTQLEISRTEEKLIPQLTEHGFASISAMNAQFLDEAERQQIQNRQQELIKSHTTLATELKTLQENHEEKATADQQPTIPLDIIEQQLLSKKQERDRLIAQTGEQLNRLTSDDSARKQRKTKQTTSNRLLREFEKWDLLNKMIGDAKGNKFANFAQGLTLQRLIAFANTRLKELSDRYLLAKPSDDGVLKVIDTFQGNTERAVSTLSGGETFLLSLALALSLSDMASKNVPLDSLFIDEGFGTLDQETLDIAMDTLERLQSDSQKTIGVISHVEALKERINVQIKLKKNAQGYSRVEVG